MSPAALCALVAALGGLIGGTTAVHGLRQNAYGPVDPPRIAGRQHVDAPAAEGFDDVGVATACDDCSERDLGYRWAVLAAIRSSDQCPNDSWGFRRGCLDFIGGS